MSDYITTIVALVCACCSVVVAPFAVAKFQLLYDIRKYNKTHTEHQLDERTPLIVFNSRFRDWHLEMFCNEKKGNTTNEK